MSVSMPRGTKTRRGIAPFDFRRTRSACFASRRCPARPHRGRPTAGLP